MDPLQHGLNKSTSLLGILEWIRLCRILFGFNNQPAPVVQSGQRFKYREKVDIAITWHGKHAGNDAVQKTQFLLFDLP